MVDDTGSFVWYELMTTDMAVARAFYADVVGWSAQDASTPGLAYTLLATAGTAISGLMALPEEALKMGATPRWMAYVGVADIEAVVDRIKRLGGAVYVPPTDSNIGRIAVVADPQTATFGLVEGLRLGQRRPGGIYQPGHVGWHELFAADRDRAFSFYRALFGWETVGDDDPAETYQLFAAGGETVGGMYTKPAMVPAPFWLCYFDVADLDVALQQVNVGGGRIFEGPVDLPGGDWIARGVDPQGAVFALRGRRTKEAIARDPASEIGWSSTWGGISSRGRLRISKPR
jgi:hypothetical protein